MYKTIIKGVFFGSVWTGKKLKNFLFTYDLLPCGSTPREPTGTQREWYSFGSSFFPAGEEICLVLETTSLDHRYIPTGFD